MTLRQIFEKTKDQLGEDSLLFQFFLQEFIGVVNKVPENPADWQDRDDLGQETIISAYRCAIDVLFSLAVQFADSTDDSVYEEATEIAKVLRSVLIEEFDVELEEVQIQSPSRMMEAVGLMEIVDGPNGEKHVKLTPEGKKAAQEVGGLVERHNTGDN